MSYFTTYFTTYFRGVGAAVQAVEQASGGWLSFVIHEQAFRKRKRERERLEEAIEEEIAALIEGVEATPAEKAVPAYVADLKSLIGEAEKLDTRFREFMARQKFRDELATLIAADRAMRDWIRSRREDEDFLTLILLAA